MVGYEWDINLKTWNVYPNHWQCTRGIHQTPVNSSHRGPVMRGIYVFFVVSKDKLLNEQNSQGGCGLRRHDAHVN